MTIDELALDGRIEQIGPDPGHGAPAAGRRQRHLRTAALVIDTGDQDAACSILYDAARKAVAAHMLASGWRVRGERRGAHATIAHYAEVVLGEGAHGKAVRELDRMRRTRNRVEYGEWGEFGAAELRADLGRARAIVAAVEAVLV